MGRWGWDRTNFPLFIFLFEKTEIAQNSFEKHTWANRAYYVRQGKNKQIFKILSFILFFEFLSINFDKIGHIPHLLVF